MIQRNRLEELIDKKATIYTLEKGKIHKLKLGRYLCVVSTTVSVPISLDIETIRREKWEIKDKLAIKMNQFIWQYFDLDKLFETKKEIKENSK